MRPLGTCYSALLNGYHGNGGRYKNVNFSFALCLQVSGCTKRHCHQLTEEKLSICKIFKFLISDHQVVIYQLPCFTCRSQSDFRIFRCVLFYFSACLVNPHPDLEASLGVWLIHPLFHSFPKSSKMYLSGLRISRRNDVLS